VIYVNCSIEHNKVVQRVFVIKGEIMKAFFAFLFALLLSASLQAAESDRFITKLKLPSGQTAVVAEGDFEARSIGSFSVRLYDAAPPEDETTFFTSGLIRARDGTIEKVMLADVNGDRKPEIVVNIRSAGSGGYLSSHAFTFDKKRLIFCCAVEGLPPQADPVAALRKSIGKGK
jgi:Periplasmic lysozyme inhibitor of I-type lysozyme